MDNKDMIERVIDYLDDCRRRNDMVRIMFDCIDANLVLDLNDRYLLRELITMIANNADSFVVPRGNTFQSPSYYDNMVKEMLANEPEDTDEESPDTKPQVEPKVPEGEVYYIMADQEPEPLDNGCFKIIVKTTLPGDDIKLTEYEVTICDPEYRKSFYAMMKVIAEQLTRRYGVPYQFCDPHGKIEAFFDRLENLIGSTKDEEELD